MVQVTVFAALLTIINWNGSTGRLLVIVSYIIVIFNSLMTIFNSVPLEHDIHGVTKSMNYVIFTIYMTYAMLPLQFRMSICCGSLVTLTHLITSISSQASTQKDVWWLVSYRCLVAFFRFSFFSDFQHYVHKERQNSFFYLTDSFMPQYGPNFY